MTDKADKDRKRIILPKKTNQVEPSEVTVVPTINSLLNDALAIVGSELAQYRSKTKRGVTLDLREARVVTGYLDALTRSSKEAREQARAEDLSELSDSELLQLATQLAKGSGNPQLTNNQALTPSDDQAEEDEG